MPRRPLRRNVNERNRMVRKSRRAGSELAGHVLAAIGRNKRMDSDMGIGKDESCRRNQDSAARDLLREVAA